VVVNRVRVTSVRRSRVYTIRTSWLVALVAVLVGVADAQAPPESGADPSMIKGPAKAPVTIVEFSDYQ
jgi:protein-disulfide isomerase